MDIATAIEMAIQHNQDEPEWTPELEAEVRAGQPFIRTRAACATSSGYRMRYHAHVLINTSIGLMEVADPQVITMARKRGATDEKMAAWWARKNFGTVLPIEWAGTDI